MGSRVHGSTKCLYVILTVTHMLFPCFLLGCLGFGSTRPTGIPRRQRPTTAGKRSMGLWHCEASKMGRPRFRAPSTPEATMSFVGYLQTLYRALQREPTMMVLVVNVQRMALAWGCALPRVLLSAHGKKDDKKGKLRWTSSNGSSSQSPVPRKILLRPSMFCQPDGGMQRFRESQVSCTRRRSRSGAAI